MLTARQVSEWEEFNKLEPLGSYKMDFMFAQLCNLILILAHSMGGNRHVRSKIQDFMPWWFTQYLPGKGNKMGGRMSTDELKKNLMAWATSHNRRVGNRSWRERKGG